ncbi:hypothetical protein A2899_04855 [Candidatus Amesbacteria bacterium RIFCSPLOWO2_01_FULL_49_25]|nr:MAG: hypothetical protein A2899_04855 [Candidatus Amesbacteria bacterium RIFCSPLOWO2_01_FULL_49_25]
MRKIFLYYNFVVVSLLVFAGFISAGSIEQLVAASLFFPLFVYFALAVGPTTSRAITIPKLPLVPKKKSVPSLEEVEPLEELPPAHKTFDVDRRAFLKIIGSAGATVFFYAIFTRRAEAAFFGSVPGPGTVALKDTAGNKIDPAERQPTDGYKITEIDDASSPAYYGFVDKTGAWFIQREESSGAYRYVRGSSSFSTNWTNRASLTYNYFDNVF